MSLVQLCQGAIALTGIVAFIVGYAGWRHLRKMPNDPRMIQSVSLDSAERNMASIQTIVGFGYGTAAVIVLLLIWLF